MYSIKINFLFYIAIIVQVVFMLMLAPLILVHLGSAGMQNKFLYIQFWLTLSCHCMEIHEACTINHNIDFTYSKYDSSTTGCDIGWIC